MSIRLSVLALSTAVALGCPKKVEEDSSSLLSQVKQGLTERDNKVSSYHLKGVTREMGLEASFEFFYRSPNKMRGVLTAPQQRIISYDGEQLFDQSLDEKHFTTFAIKLPPEKRALFLTQSFAPFASEGYRTPLLLRDGVQVVKGTHPKGPQTVEMTMAARSEGGQDVSVTYVLRWPSLDFLAKRVKAGQETQETRVDEEHCEEKLKMCFPKKLTQVQGATSVATTSLTVVEINPALPADTFTLKPPEGYEVKQQELVEAGK